MNTCTSSQPNSLTIDDVIKAAEEFRARHNVPPSAFKMSKLTADFLTRHFAVIERPSSWQSIYGIPLITDESIPFGQFKVVPAIVD